MNICGCLIHLAPGYLEEYNHVVQKLAAQPHQGPIDVAGIKSFLGTQSE